MRLGVETKVRDDIRYTVDYTRHGEITVLARSLKSGRTKLCMYETSDYNFRDGYCIEDVLEIERIIEEFCEDLKDG